MLKAALGYFHICWCCVRGRLLCAMPTATYVSPKLLCSDRQLLFGTL